MALRRVAVPQVTAYWLMSAFIAAHAASFMGSGIGKSGKPCARFTASCWLAMRVISRMTDSVNDEVRRAASISDPGKAVTDFRPRSGERLVLRRLVHPDG